MAEEKKVSNSDYGMTLQKVICEKYDLEINEWAYGQFNGAFNSDYKSELEQVVPIIFDRVDAKPRKLLTYTTFVKEGKEVFSPHNFELDNGKTLSIRTNKSGDIVAPRIIGQAGFERLNEYFGDIYGKPIVDQNDIKKLVLGHIHEMFPIFIGCMFISDMTVLYYRDGKNEMQVISADEVGNYEFVREDFSFTREYDAWIESTTLKYHGISVAEIQIHKNRSFKFRFITSNIPAWFNKIKITNETFGISAEAAICEVFDLQKPESFRTRASVEMVKKLLPVVKKAFEKIPPAVEHTGSTPGERGEQSKCAYDFVLDGNQTLSLKTNKGKMVCPPEVGQPGSATCLLYFKEYLDAKDDGITNESFKRMVYDKIDEIMPIYVQHLFDSDWLMWIREEKERYTHQEIHKNEINNITWEKSRFSFTKPTIEEWNESNTVKYDGNTIGEFQVHKNRDCYKFRFNLENLLKIIRK